MPELFEPVSLKSMTLQNRFVRSATWEGLAGDDGAATPRLAELLAELARNEVGLVIPGHAFVSPEGRAGFKQLGAHDDAMLPGLSALASAVHRAGGRIALQLAHAGAAAAAQLSGLPAVGPSAPKGEGEPACAELDQAGMSALVQAFARAAARAKKAGIDAVQIHGAHGYLLSQFLSPAWNRRTDGYGGALENRARLLLEVAAAVRAAVGPDYPVLAKLNSEDFVPGGFSPAEAAAVAAMLEEASVDAVELSGGSRAAGEERMPARKGRIKGPEDEVYYREAARLYKERVKIPLILVGGIRSYEIAEELVRSGAADLISLSRPLICEPALVKRWHEGDTRPAECVSDNACYTPILAGEGVRCETFAKKRARAAGK
ncbi:NADH:flavin oxidoreductase [Desulfovibrio sp. X2]|uniref:NADH:flavin oxidoreductase n=1 Tax=Desulfovibrio sp. X2 TaxID=941449 RepID=UPI0003F91E2A|nr:NADH:flavin oxidoreductase [Desulfovibrio sp. X2]